MFLKKITEDLDTVVSTLNAVMSIGDTVLKKIR